MLIGYNLLIDHLGLITLIITDLMHGANQWYAVQPVRGQNQVTRNDTLKSWVLMKTYDKLLDLKSEQKIKKMIGFIRPLSLTNVQLVSI